MPTRTSCVTSLAVIARAEFGLRLRSSALPYQIFFIVALAALLVPRPGANYAIISSGRAWLRLGPDSAMLTITAVLGMSLLLLLPLFLDFGMVRDRTTGVVRIHRSLGLDTIPFGLGRGLGLFAFAGVFVGCCWAILYATLWLRYANAPSIAAVAASLGLLTLVVALSVPAAIVIEVVGRGNAGLRTLLAFLWWTACLILSIDQVADPAGIGLLRAALPPALADQGLSVGFVSIAGHHPVEWARIATGGVERVLPRIEAAIVTTLVGLAAAGVLGTYALRLGAAPAGRSSYMVPHQYRERATARPFSARSLRAPVAPGYASTIVMVLAHWSRRSPLGCSCVLVALAAGCVSPKAGLIVALVSMILFIRRTSAEEARLARRFEPSLAAFGGAAGLVIHSLALAATTMFAALPAIAAIPITQAATAALGIATASLWLVWTHRYTAVPVLGLSVLGAIIYVTGFNKVPPALDIMGFTAASTVALIVQAMLLVALTATCGLEARTRQS